MTAGRVRVAGRVSRLDCWARIVRAVDHYPTVAALVRAEPWSLEAEEARAMLWLAEGDAGAWDFDEARCA